MPWGDREQKSGNFMQHINLRHQFEYDRFVVNCTISPIAYYILLLFKCHMPLINTRVSTLYGPQHYAQSNNLQIKEYHVTMKVMRDGVLLLILYYYSIHGK